MEKVEFIRKIQANISASGYHVTTVVDGTCPRFSYTIGLKYKIGCELIFAGGENNSTESVTCIVDGVYKHLSTSNCENNAHVDLGSLGSFIVSEVDPSWSQLLLLGAFDFYQTTEIKVCQIVPEQRLRTLDVPDLTRTFNIDDEPIWKWLTLGWPYSIPYNSIAITNISSLYGQKLTEATRWEENEWEIFSGSGQDVDKQSICAVPLATLLGIDSSLEPVIYLQIGKGLWRDSDELSWSEWE